MLKPRHIKVLASGAQDGIPNVEIGSYHGGDPLKRPYHFRPQGPDRGRFQRRDDAEVATKDAVDYGSNGA
uniref:Uncharacterized protein n=1 Tax=Arundo donax TaxID=35708 RepID=A0A0A9GKX4_ARUDO